MMSWRRRPGPLGPGLGRVGLLAMVVAAALALSACLSQPHPVKNQYRLSAEPEKSATRTDRRTLLVGAVTVAAGYDNRGLVYRVGPERVEADFYNEFVAPPARLLADQTAQYLDQANNRVRVVKTPGLTLAQFGLETYLEYLHGDFTVDPPRAEIGIRFTLNDLRGSTTRVIFDKTYRRSSPLAERSPAALVAGLSECLREVLAELNRDIEKNVR